MANFAPFGSTVSIGFTRTCTRTCDMRVRVRPPARMMYIYYCKICKVVVVRGDSALILNELKILQITLQAAFRRKPLQSRLFSCKLLMLIKIISL